MKYEYGEYQIAYFDFQPAEPMTRDYPGCDASVEIYSVTAYGIETMHGMTEEQLREKEQECLEYALGTYETAAAAREDYEYEQRKFG